MESFASGDLTGADGGAGYSADMPTERVAGALFHRPEILADAKSRGYDGWIAIEPHVATVFHVKDQSQVDWQQCYDSYVDYGKRMEKILAGL